MDQAAHSGQRVIPSEVSVYEVGPRDGLQNEAAVVAEALASLTKCRLVVVAQQSVGSIGPSARSALCAGGTTAVTGSTMNLQNFLLLQQNMKRGFELVVHFTK